MDRKTIRCFCQHENGGAERNGILCGIADEESGIVEAGYQKVGNCEMNEWCTGPTSSNHSVEGAISHSKRKLCTKGSYKFFIMSLYLIIKRQLGRPSQTLLCIIAADVPCGSGVETMAPSCSMCERNNDSKSNSWCSGFCLFDAVDRVCKERCKFLSYNPSLPIKVSRYGSIINH